MTKIISMIRAVKQSPVGILRARACWVSKKFSSIDFKDKQNHRKIPVLNSKIRLTVVKRLDIIIEKAKGWQ